MELALPVRARLLEFLLVSLEDIDADERGTGGDYRRPLLQKRSVVHRELADLEAHIADELLLVISEETHVSLDGDLRV